MYIYIVLLLFILRVRFNWSVFCTSDAFHIRIRNDRSEQVCVWGSIGACSVSLTASHAHTHTPINTQVMTESMAKPHPFTYQSQIVPLHIQAFKIQDGHTVAGGYVPSIRCGRLSRKWTKSCKTLPSAQLLVSLVAMTQSRHSDKKMRKEHATKRDTRNTRDTLVAPRHASYWLAGSGLLCHDHTL